MVRKYYKRGYRNNSRDQREDCEMFFSKNDMAIAIFNSQRLQVLELDL